MFALEYFHGIHSIVKQISPQAALECKQKSTETDPGMWAVYCVSDFAYVCALKQAHEMISLAKGETEKEKDNDYA